MAFGHGTNARLYVHALDMSGYVEEVAVNYDQDMAESKPLSSSFVSRYPGHKRVTVTLSGGGFDAESGANAEAVWAQLTEATAGRPFAFMPAGDAFGRVAHCGIIKPNSIQVVAAGDDIVRLPVGALSLEEVDFCRVLRALASGGTSPSASYDASGGSTTGASYLICTAMSGDTPELTVTFEHSTNDVDWDTLVAMTALDAAGSERKEISGTINRYVRVSWTLTGTDPSATWFAALGRRD